MDLNDQREVLIYAFRYALGRMSMAVYTMVEVILDCWEDLSQFDKELIVKEIKEADKWDEIGMDMDKKMWFRIINRYEDEIQNKS